jgi:hypothetical protein
MIREPLWPVKKVHAHCDLAKDDGGVLLVLENPPDRKANLIGTLNRCRDLIKQGLKQVVIRAIDQDDFRGRILEGLGGSQASKTTADYNDWRLSHLLLTSFRPFCRTPTQENNATGSPSRNR